VRIEGNILYTDCNCKGAREGECRAKIKIVKYNKNITVAVGTDGINSHSIDLDFPTLIAIAAFIFKENT